MHSASTGDEKMKTGLTLNEAAVELARRNSAKRDFVANTRRLHVEAPRPALGAVGSALGSGTEHALTLSLSPTLLPALPKNIVNNYYFKCLSTPVCWRTFACLFERLFIEKAKRRKAGGIGWAFSKKNK